MIQGGCFCGKIRYAIEEGEHLVANCHCSMCRKISAAPFVTWMVVPASAFRYLKGEPKRLASSEKGERFFCPDCGSPVACRILDRPEEVDVPTGSLDEPDRFPPTLAVHEDSRLSWLGATETKAG